MSTLELTHLQVKFRELLLLSYDNAVEQQLPYNNAVEQLKDFLGGYHSYLVGPWTGSGF